MGADFASARFGQCGFIVGLDCRFRFGERKSESHVAVKWLSDTWWTSWRTDQPSGRSEERVLELLVSPFLGRTSKLIWGLGDRLYGCIAGRPQKAIGDTRIGRSDSGGLSRCSPYCVLRNPEVFCSLVLYILVS